MSKTRDQYRRWIKDRHGSLHKVDTNDAYKGRNGRINQNHIRDTFIDEYESSPFVPSYMITVSYYYEQYDMQEVKDNNDRMNKVIDDLFNPRNMSKYVITKDHFIERHKDKLVKKKPQKVLDTIKNEYEFDWEMEIKKGGLHVHTLVSDIHDDVITRPNSKIRRLIEKEYGMDQIPISLQQDDWGLNQVKMALLERCCRERCHYIGDSKKSLVISNRDEYGSYDGYIGWKGMVAYVTKTMYNVDNIVEVYDRENSSILYTE